MDDQDKALIAGSAVVIGMIIWKRHNRQKKLTAQVTRVTRQIENLMDTYSLARQIEMDRKFIQIVRNYDN